MSFEFKPEYYQAQAAKSEELQAMLIKQGIQAPGIFDLELRLKWKKLCLEQTPILPNPIPNAWKLKLEKANLRTLNFLDCSRELIKEAA